MMKHTIKSPIRKLKLLLVLPLMTGIFYAFAAPEYKFIQTMDNPGQEERNVIQDGKSVTGKVISEDGKPLKSASIVVSGKMIGTSTDASGNFKLELTDDSPIVISYVGYASQKVKPDFEKEMVIILKTVVIGIDAISVVPSAEKSDQGEIKIDNALIIIDGKETTKSEKDKISPTNIESITVLKDQSATILYGEKGKNGVVLITLKKDKDTESENKSTDVVVVGHGYGEPKKEGLTLNTNTKIRITGTNGYENMSKPLIVLDGIISTDKDMENIEPETIKSVSILKGESAIKLYGEKAKNGVIIITSKKASDVFTAVEEMPAFPGGVAALKTYVSATLQYPAIALEKGIQGKVFVNFVVAEDGSVTEAKVTRSVDPSLDKEALRIVTNLPRWSPGSQAGEPVRVSYTLPIDFKLPPEKISKEKLH